MATKATSSAAAMDEIAIVENEIFDFSRAGKPYDNLICPRCGGELTLLGNSESHTIQCETAGCIEYTVRGI